MKDVPPIPKDDLKVVLESAELTAAVQADRASKKEEGEFKGGNYEDADAQDSYGIRRALKGQIAKHARLIFYTLYSIFIFIVLSLATMAGCYIWNLFEEPDKMAYALGTVATHSMAAMIGLLATAYYGKIKRH